MKNRALTAALLVFIFSCQKEIDHQQLQSSNVSSLKGNGKRIYFTQPGNCILKTLIIPRGTLLC
jgi:hypothetical protein